MSYCKFKKTLEMLKESSRAAVIDGAHGTFDSAKRYLHLERPVEKKLREILRSASEAPGTQLVLLCGNVGDGKSHLITRLRETDPDLLSSFVIQNDATESSRWDATNIDELRNVLASHSNTNLPEGSQKTLIAINLGTLNNFILAESNNGFSQLREFVEKKKILETGELTDNSFLTDSPFQFVSFCDYSLFDITREGPVSDLIENALARIVKEDKRNPFHAALCQDCENTAIGCPIRNNYLLMRREMVRTRLSSMLIECIVKHHQIISVRALYNLIYDILIPPLLDRVTADNICDKVANMSPEEILKTSLINSPFDHPEASTILRHLHDLDPSLRRTQEIDERIIALMVSEQPKLPEEFGISTPIQLAFGNQRVKSEIRVSTFVRSQYFFGKDSSCFTDPVYSEFMQLVFSWYTEDKEAIKGA
jgi:DNA phosphorothioation-dependent restriction protein DptF